MRQFAFSLTAALTLSAGLLAIGGTASAGLKTSPVWTFESNSPSAQLGFQVGTAGDVNNDGYSDVLVSSSTYSGGDATEGKVWCFLGGPNGPASSAHWSAEGNQAGARFGYSARTAGDVNGDGYDDVIVGAWGYSNGQAEEGAAFVYYGSPSGLPASPSWTKQSNAAGIRFGEAAAGVGDVNGDGYDDVLIGAPEYSGDQNREGRAYLYLGGPSGLASGSAWTAESNVAISLFAATLSPAGDVNADGYDDVVIGALSYDNGNLNEGAFWVYLGNSGGLSNTALWKLEGNADSRYYGETLACAGDVNGDGYSDFSMGWSISGIDAVWVYYGGAGGPDTNSDVVFVSENSNSFNGGSFTAGDVNGDGFADFVVGDGLADGAETDQGQIRLFLGGATDLSTNVETFIWGETGQSLAQFGVNCGPAGDVNGDGYGDVIAAAPYFDNGQNNEGKVYVYLGEPSKTAGTVDWSLEPDQINADLGYATAFGDWNGDGYSDLATGARLYDAGQANEGIAFVDYFGPHGVTASMILQGDQDNAHFGQSLATAGDVNGDGYEDLLVGAPDYSNGEAGEGRVVLYNGSSSGVLTTAWTGEANQANASHGWSVASAGDVNGDGYSDVIIGTPDYETGGPIGEGIAFVYYGSASGLPIDNSWNRSGGEPNANLGYSVACAGDVNGDGYSDVIIGAPRKDNGQVDEGVAYIYHGSASGLSTVAATILQSNQSNSSYGGAVSSAGDVNGDGYSDVIVGASSWSNGNTTEGAAFVYLGGPAGVSTIADWSVESNQDGARRGSAVGCAGDVNGDGYSDVMVGTPQYTTDVTNEGRATVWFGGPSGLGASTGWIVNGGQSSARFGSALAGGGDVNADGFADIAIGAPDYDNGQDSEGIAFLYQGNEAGLDRRPRQLRSNGSTPISLYGLSDRSDSITLSAYGRTPIGRGKVKLQYVAAPLGAGFGSIPNTWPVEFDTGAPAGSNGSRVLIVTDPLVALEDDTAFHWRLRLRTDSPFFPWTPWLSMARNGKTETDFRTIPNTTDAPSADLAGPSIRFARVWPNPFAESVSMSFVLPQSGEAKLSIFDAQGRRVATLNDGALEAGEHLVSWAGDDARGQRAPAGVYFARLESSGAAREKKIVLAR